MNFKLFEIYLDFICQCAIRPGSARCTGPEISHNTANGSGFTKLLFRLRLVHCATVIPFILHFPSLFSFTFKRGEKRSEKFDKRVNNNNPLRLRLFFLLRHVKILACTRDMIMLSRCFQRVVCYIVNMKTCVIMYFNK